MSGSTDYFNPPCRPSRASSSERRALWLTFHLQTPSTAYPSPLAATTPSAASHVPQTAHLGPSELAIPSATSNAVAQKGA